MRERTEAAPATWKGALAAMLLGALAVTLFAEGVLRWVVPQLDAFKASKRVVLFPRYVQDVEYGDFRIRQNIPGAHYWHTSVDGRWEFQINEQGFRDRRDFAYEKPQGTIRIGVLGDSMTAGYEARQDAIYPAIVERYLRGRDVPAQVLNAGVSGFGTAEQLVVLEHHLLRFDLDYLVLGFFRNDLVDNVKAGLFGLEDGELVVRSRSYVPGIRIANFLYRYTPHAWLNEHSFAYTYAFNALYDLAKESLRSRRLREVEQQVMPAGGAGGGRGGGGGEVADYQHELAAALLRRIHAICRERGIPFVLLDIPTTLGGPSLPEQVRRRPEGFADVVIPGREVLADYFGVVRLFVPHGHRHLNETGHLLLGMELARTLERLERGEGAAAGSPRTARAGSPSS